MRHQKRAAAISGFRVGQATPPVHTYMFTKPYTDQEKWVLTTFVAQITHCTWITLQK